MSAYNYRTRGNPVIFILPPSAYRGQPVRVLRSKCAYAVNAVGVVTSHNTTSGTLCVQFADGRTVWTHTNNVTLISDTRPAHGAKP